MYPEYILRKLRQRKGLYADDKSMDDALNSLSSNQAFSEVLEWEGICGYSTIIRKLVEDIFDVELNW